jgi:uncharacterized protein (TIGR00288 family)
MSDEPLIAVFIDYENLAIGVGDMPGKKRADLDIGLVLKRLLEKGRIVAKRAYCDWNRFQDAVRSLHQQGVLLIDTPSSKLGGKNSADIHMVVDAMDLCFSREHIDSFALLSGDSDFSPLVSKLKELDKRVIGCGVKSSTSQLLVSGCDEFIYYDDLVRQAADRPRAPRAKKRTPEEDRRGEGLDQVVEIIRSLARDYERVWGSMIKQTVGRVSPGFNHEYYGYKSFVELLRDLAARGIIELREDVERGNQLVRLKDVSTADA